MTYSTRSSHYLRISKQTVLPVFLYLDERHSSSTLPPSAWELTGGGYSILPKLKAEADNLTSTNSAQKKASTVDTHRGDNYQFCYFLRKTEPHSVVIKTRNFTLAPPVQNTVTNPMKAPQKKKGKRKEMDVDPSQATIGTKKRKRTGRTVTPPPGTRRDEDDYEMVVNEDETPANKEGPAIELEIEEDEEKPKPILGLKYQGFNIYGHCLCLVVEPWPVIRSTTVPSILDSRSNIRSQGQTPLFLPETGHDINTERPAEAAHVNQPYLDRILSGSGVSDDEGEDTGGMMDFSQVLNNIGDARPGAVNDDDDMDGSILFGDADEFKEL